MIFKNAMSFKGKIKQVAKDKGITTQQIQQSYLIEVFLRNWLNQTTEITSLLKVAI
ncbi:hypothetical protein IRB23SM22_09460 [Alkalibacterium sp. s-m-22]|uniref:Uncharacterized protein n=1 Tax=Alkalibacterium indicireducens TaxID=398758 RepID=A0ABN1AXB4_9LACT